MSTFLLISHELLFSSKVPHIDFIVILHQFISFPSIFSSVWFAFSWIFNDSDQSQFQTRFLFYVCFPPCNMNLLYFISSLGSYIFFFNIIFCSCLSKSDIYLWNLQDDSHSIFLHIILYIFMVILLVILVFLEEKDYYRHHPNSLSVQEKNYEGN